MGRVGIAHLGCAQLQSRPIESNLGAAWAQAGRLVREIEMMRDWEIIAARILVAASLGVLIAYVLAQIVRH